MTLVLVFLFLLYIALLVVLILGWNKAMAVHGGKTELGGDKPLISIIVAVRNEEKIVGHLMEDLSRQHYDPFQVIMVDDHSEDNTVQVVLHHCEIDDRFVLLKGGGVGKKAALTQGIDAAAGSIIVTTDADCRVSEHWIYGLQSCFVDENVKMVFGGVKMDGNTFFTKIQTLEFMSLIGSGAATAALGFPTMCNGANLAFRKSAFEEVNGYHGNFHIPSGDDEFLMKKFLRQYPGSVLFAADPETIVTTAPNKDLEQFIHQRIRWAGKWRLHQSLTSKVLALFVFCFQTAVMLLPFFIIVNWVSLETALLLWLPKMVLEFLFLWRISHFLSVCWSWRAFILLQLIYPFYTTLIGLASNVFSFEWKGRKLKSLMVSNN